MAHRYDIGSKNVRIEWSTIDELRAGIERAYADAEREIVTEMTTRNIDPDEIDRELERCRARRDEEIKKALAAAATKRRT